MDPARGDEPERAGPRRRVRQLHLHEVRARDALIRPAAGEIDVAGVARGREIRDVASLVVPNRRERLDRPGGDDLQLRRRHREPFVDEDLGVVRMIDDEQGDEIEEVRFPQLRRDAQIVGAVARRELIAADLDPVLGHQHVSRRLRVDAEPERRPPDEIGDERHLAAVPGEEPRARSLEALRRRHRLVRLRVELRLQRAVRPGDAHDFGAVRLAKAEVDERRGDDLLLEMQPGAKLDLAADAERVDALIAGRRRGARTEDLPPIRLRRLDWTRGRVARPGQGRRARASRRRRGRPPRARRAGASPAAP